MHPEGMTSTQITVHPWLVEHSCWGCGAAPHTPHGEGCDHAVCAATGRQYWCCEGEYHEHAGRGYGEHEGACQAVVWDGLGSTARAAGLRGWYAECVAGAGWQARSLTEALARPDEVYPDLNRVVMELSWDESTLSYRG